MPVVINAGPFQGHLLNSYKRKSNWILIVIGGIISAISTYFDYNITRKLKKPYLVIIGIEGKLFLYING